MRITAIILVVFTLHVNAKGWSQDITYSATAVPLEKVFSVIKQQSGFTFFYRSEDLNETKPVTVSLKNIPFQKAMEAILKGQPLDFEIEGRTVVLTKKVADVRQSLSSALSIDVKGKVINDKGEPVVGATVKVKGSLNGTSTNAKGEFVLQGLEAPVILVISGAELQTQEIKVSDENPILIRVGTKIGELDQLVVVAYGTTTRRLSTGNIGKVTAEEIEKQPVNNPLLALQGRIPGLLITQGNGVPGSSVTVQVQGQNSIKKGNDPFYVVDGVPYISQMLPTYSTGFASEILGGNSGTYSTVGSPLNYLNPGDIESIEVLKDADATAIYGSRAANGAILITTKKAKAGPAKITLGYQTGLGKVANKLDMLNTEQYIEMRKEAIRNDLDMLRATRDYDIMGLNGWDTLRSIDWQNELIGGTAKFNNINAGISGGNEQVQYLIGGNYQSETSVFPGKFIDKKGGAHINVSSASLNKKFRIQFSGNYMSDNNRLPKQDLTSVALSLAPTAPLLYNSDGTLNWGLNAAGSSTWTNPLAQTIANFQSQTDNLIANSLINYELLPGLDIRSNFGYSKMDTKSFLPMPLQVNAPQNLPTAVRLAYYSFNMVKSWIIEPQVSFKRTIRNVNIDILAGATIQQNNSEGQSLYGEGFNSDILMKDIRSAASLSVDNSLAMIYKYGALFTKVNFNLKNKYILNLSARRDGSSRFGEKNQMHNFGSIGAAWIFSEENWIKANSNLGLLSFAKLRASYGTTGNDQIGDYQYMNLYNSVSVPSLVPYQGQVGLAPQGIANPYLMWEETKKAQFGLELGLFRDKVLLNATYVYNRSDNQLLSSNLPIQTGFASIVTNLPAVVTNTNWEFLVDLKLIQRANFRWTASLNLTIPRNRLIKYEGLKSLPDGDFYEIGQPVNLIKAYKFLGVDPVTGSYTFQNKAGSGVNIPTYSTDRTVFISNDPTYYGGIQSAVSYKSLELGIFFQVVKQMKGSSFRGIGGSTPGFRRSNQPVTVLDRWQNEGDQAPVQRFNTMVSPNYPSLVEQYGFMQASDAFYSNVFFARLKNVSLAYNFPKQLLMKAGVQSLKLFVHLQNFLTITNFEGLDPETGNAALPPLKMMTVGLNVSL